MVSIEVRHNIKLKKIKNILETPEISELDVHKKKAQISDEIFKIKPDEFIRFTEFRRKSENPNALPLTNDVHLAIKDTHKAFSHMYKMWNRQGSAKDISKNLDYFSAKITEITGVGK